MPLVDCSLPLCSLHTRVNCITALCEITATALLAASQARVHQHMPSNSASELLPLWQLGWPAAPPDAQKILKTLLATPLAPLALLAGTPGHQGSIQANPSASLRFLNRSFYSSIVLYYLFARGTRKTTLPMTLSTFVSLPIFFGINHLLTGTDKKQFERCSC